MAVPTFASLLLAIAALVPQPAAAREVFVGMLAHAVDTPLTFETGERGVDVQIGYRGGRIGALSAIGAPSPYAFVSVNSVGDTDLAAAGLAWTLGRGRVFVRPGIGIAIQDGPRYRVFGGYQTQLGSRVLFEPELGIGLRAAPRVTIDAQWTHVSHARIFGPQNPGLDMIGTRLSFALR